MTIRDSLAAATPAELTEAYLTLRLKRDAARAVEKETTGKMELIGSYIMAKLVELGQDGFRARGSTVFKSELTTAKVEDREAFFKFIKEASAFDLLEARVSKDAAEQYLADNGEPVPGVKMDKIVRLNVRKGS